MKTNLKVKIKKLVENAVIPSYAKERGTGGCGSTDVKHNQSVVEQIEKEFEL